MKTNVTSWDDVVAAFVKGEEFLKEGNKARGEESRPAKVDFVFA